MRGWVLLLTAVVCGVDASSSVSRASQPTLAPSPYGSATAVEPALSPFDASVVLAPSPYSSPHVDEGRVHAPLRARPGSVARRARQTTQHAARLFPSPYELPRELEPSPYEHARSVEIAPSPYGFAAANVLAPSPYEPAPPGLVR